MVDIVAGMIGEEPDEILEWPAEIIQKIIQEIQKLSGLKVPAEGEGSPAGN